MKSPELLARIELTVLARQDEGCELRVVGKIKILQPSVLWDTGQFQHMTHYATGQRAILLERGPGIRRVHESSEVIEPRFGGCFSRKCK